MSSFDRYQAMMLDYAYGLLEPEQIAELEAFLASGPEGEVLRLQSEEWMRRLSLAAKSEFPSVRFTPPEITPPEITPPEHTPAVAPIAAPIKSAGKKAESPRITMKHVWTRWALAASVLLVVCGMGIPAARHYFGHREKAAQVAENKHRVEKAESDFKSFVANFETQRKQVDQDEALAKAEYEQLQKDSRDQMAAAERAVEKKQFIVQLSGPERAQPGAPNEWKVAMYKRNGADAMPTKVEWAVKDKDGQTVWSETKKAPGNSPFPYPPVISLPVSFWEKVKPDSDLYMEVTAFDDKLKSQVSARVGLARPVYTTHLATDKPLYKQGETVYFRSLTLDRSTFLPPERDMLLEFRIVQPDGSTVSVDSGIAKLYTNPDRFYDFVKGPDKKALRGIGCGEYIIDPHAPGGEYKLLVVDVTPNFNSVKNQHLPTERILETRKFNVVEYKPEIFDKTLEFDGKSYGPSDVVMVKCTVSRTQGGKLKNGIVNAWGSVDGQPITIINPGKTDQEGAVRLKFTLPKNITRGEGSLTVTFSELGGGAESIIRPIPVVGRIIKVEFYPEGGDLVENVPSRVYFQAKTHTGKPADLKGYITDGSRKIADISTLTDADEPGVNRGQGVFTFTPKPGKKYYLKVRKPEGIIENAVSLPLSPAAVAAAIGQGNLGGIGAIANHFGTGFELPKAKEDGVVLTALDPLTKPDQAIRARVQTGAVGKSLVVGAYARGRLIDHKRVTLEPNKAAEVSLSPNVRTGGVTRLTVFEEKQAGENKSAELVPVAERLVYRRPAKQLMLNVSPDKLRYNPASQVGIDITAFDEDEKPAAAILMVGVVNQSVLTMADEKTGRLMPTQFLLASEVNKPEDLEHADFLLYDPDAESKSLTNAERMKSEMRRAKAAEALDVLLGTQGWRRFAEQHAIPAGPDNGSDVDRLLVSNGQRSAIPVETFRQEEEKVIAEYQPKLEVALTQLNDKITAKVEMDSQVPIFENQKHQLDSTRNFAKNNYNKSLAELQSYETDINKSRSLLFAGLCVGLLGIAGACALIGVWRKGRRSVPYFATATGSLALCALVVVGVVMMRATGDKPFAIDFDDKKAVGASFTSNMPMPAKMEMPTDPGADTMPASEPKTEEKAKADEVEKRLDKLTKEANGNFGGRGLKAEDGGRGGAAFDKPRAMMAPGMAAPVPTAAPALPRGAGGPQANFGARFNGGGLGKGVKDAAMDDKFREGIALADAKKVKGAAQGKPNAFRDGRERGKMRQAELFERQNRFGLDRAEKAAGMQLRGPRPPVRGGNGLPHEQRDLEQQLAKDDYDQLQRAGGFFVREFKFKKEGDQSIRDNFAETIYWHPALVLPESGKTEIRFQLSDSICRYQVLVAGHTVDGRIGAITTHIEARKPFTVDPKLPIEVNSNDQIDVPVRVVNDSDLQRTVSFHVTPSGLIPADPSQKLVNGQMQDWLELAANKKGRKIMSFLPSIKQGTASLTVVGTSVPMDVPDQITRTFRVMPEGFPAAGAVSDLLEKKAFANFELPKDYVKGTLKVQVQVYPTTLADLQSGLESLLREPCGCFEQTSTSNYPNLLILDYLKSSDQAKPELAQRAKDLLDRGYQKLVGFECPKSDTHDKRGFEWFGQADRQHQALTAYGLLQFKDLAKVFKVDPELIRRTQTYLLGQQNANKDGFQRNQTAIDTFGRAPEYITNAYIVWALVESDPDDKEGMTDLLKQLDFLKKHAKEHPQGKNDPYFLSLVANSLLQRPTNGNREAAVAILERIAEKHLKNGVVEGATTSITCSGGRDLQIESTALTVLAWLRAGEPKFMKHVKESAKWIGQQRGGYGGFGSTQSTILALKALIEYTKHNKKPAEDGEYRLTVNGKTFKKTFTAKDQEVLTLEIENPDQVFVAGKNEAALEITTKQAYPFSLTWSCNTLTPLSSDKCAVEVAAKLDRKNAAEGEAVRVNVSMRNKLKEGHGMAVAIVGLPGGCRLPADLKELTKLREDGKISYFEIRGRELVLYWRSLKPEEKIDVSIGLLCEVPGQFRGPASRAYLYYNADPKHWIEPLAITITPSDPKANEEVAVK